MIIPSQTNLKVHFAGTENKDFAMVLCECAKMKYALFTVFPFIAGKVGIKPTKFSTCVESVTHYLTDNCRHVIMDSGLFTLMFGAHAGKRDLDFVTRWYKNIVSFVRENNYSGTVVEVDCQKVLGVENAWKFREMMKQDLPNNRQINVFHIEDGQKGLERMIEFSDYIAISVPELRAIGKVSYVNQVAHFIKNKKPDIDIHLLGCTENKILNDLRFCSSADSTSWQQVNRYGSIKYNNGIKTIKIHNRDISFAKIKERYGEKIVEILESLGETPKDKRIAYLGKYAIAVEFLRKQYTIYAGDQD